MGNDEFSIVYVCPICGKEIKIETGSIRGPIVEAVDRFQTPDEKTLTIWKIIQIECYSCKSSILVKPRPKSFLALGDDSLYDAV